MRTLAACVVVASLAVALPAAAQEPKKTEPAAVPAAMPMPKPGPEHQLLADEAGTWDAKVEIFMAPGAAPMVSSGVEVNTLGCGGLCLITDFKGEMGPGATFHGHGTAVWDPAKKKYVGTWTDSMSSGISIGESTYDAAKKVSTGWMEGADHTGKMVKHKSTVEYKGDQRVFSMFSVAPDGKETLGMRITYTRRKS